jgi:hypothetical protein
MQTPLHSPHWWNASLFPPDRWILRQFKWLLLLATLFLVMPTTLTYPCDLMPLTYPNIAPKCGSMLAKSFKIPAPRDRDHRWNGGSWYCVRWLNISFHWCIATMGWPHWPGPSSTTPISALWLRFPDAQYPVDDSKVLLCVAQRIFSWGLESKDDMQEHL